MHSLPCALNRAQHIRGQFRSVLFELAHEYSVVDAPQARRLFQGRSHHVTYRRVSRTRSTLVRSAL
eukprot:578089-Pleurochrysis_carterae.AAC.1